MSAVRHQISENDFVELREMVEGWPSGESGTVVAERGDWRLVEISDDQGIALDFISVPETQLDLIAKHSEQPSQRWLTFLRPREENHGGQ